MALLKCKMCGGDLHIEEGMTVCECEYCGSKQTVPTVDNEKKINLFLRADRLRRECEFDKAAGIYESIIAEFPAESEAYWGLCLCRYGIEYVDDPSTAKKIPTCHRTEFRSIFEDQNFLATLEYSDTVATMQYREEAKEIERLQKSILEIAAKEEPFDVFICYKETDENGQRTKDSVMAQDIYTALIDKGYKVFFARITLEDKLGQEYEPFIFSALNSAKIMLAIGTNFAFFDAVWVKNEWKRFLEMKKDNHEKVLIPCYSDIDAYDMPVEFRNLQAQDMNKVGFIQDLIRGIEKILGTHKVVEKIATAPAYDSEADSLVKRGIIALEDMEWERAYGLFDKALEKSPEMAEAYLGQAFLDNKCSNIDSLKKILLKKEKKIKSEESTIYYIENSELKKFLQTYVVDNYLSAKQIKDLFSSGEKLEVTSLSIENVCKELETFFAKDRHMSRAIKYSAGKTREDLEKLKDEVLSYFQEEYNSAKARESLLENEKVPNREVLAKEAMLKLDTMYNEAVEKRKADYDYAAELVKKAKSAKDFQLVADLYKQIGDYEQSLELSQELIIYAEKKRKNEKKLKLIVGIGSVVSILIITTLLIAIFTYFIPNSKYKKALELSKSGNYDAAIDLLEDINYANSEDWILYSKYEKAKSLYDEKKYNEAESLFEELGDYAKSKSMLTKTKYGKAVELSEAGDYEKAIEAFNELSLEGEYDKEINKLQREIAYSKCIALIESGKYEEAARLVSEMGDASCEDEKVIGLYEKLYVVADSLLQEDNYDSAMAIFTGISSYKDSGRLLFKCSLELQKAGSVGDSFFMGTSTDGKNSPIEWIVIEKTDNRLTAISKEYVITTNRGGISSYSVCWNAFYKKTFSEFERNYIDKKIQFIDEDEMNDLKDKGILDDLDTDDNSSWVITTANGKKWKYVDSKGKAYSNTVKSIGIRPIISIVIFSE